MSTTARNTDKDFPKAPAGTHVARCYQVIDLGHQKIVWNNQEKWQPKVLLTWEILGEERMEDGRPFAVSSRFTLSLSEKSALRPILEAWRGKPFTKEEADGFDVKKVLGAYCMLNVVHNQVGDKTYANVAAVMALPKGMPKPAPVNQDLYFNLDDGDMAKLPDWLQNIVKKSKEKMGSFEDMKDDIPWSEDHVPGLDGEVTF
jgi:hypothetical protein